MCGAETSLSSTRDVSANLDLYCFNLPEDSPLVSEGSPSRQDNFQPVSDALHDVEQAKMGPDAPLRSFVIDTSGWAGNFGRLSAYEGAPWISSASVIWRANAYDAAEQVYAWKSFEKAHSGSLLLWSSGLGLRTFKMREWGVVLFVFGNRHDVYNGDDKFKIYLGPDLKPLFDLNLRDFLTEEVVVVQPVEPPDGPLKDRGSIAVMPARNICSAPETHFIPAEELRRK